MRLGPTMYFGELALLRGEPRAATVAALTDTSVLMLAREDFTTLLGPLQMLLGQNAALYGPTEATATNKQVRTVNKHCTHSCTSKQITLINRAQRCTVTDHAVSMQQSAVLCG